MVVFGLNGQRIEVDLSQVDPATTLLDYLRYHTQYNGAKLGCGEGMTWKHIHYIYIFFVAFCDSLKHFYFTLDVTETISF